MKLQLVCLLAAFLVASVVGIDVSLVEDAKANAEITDALDASGGQDLTHDDARVDGERDGDDDEDEDYDSELCLSQETQAKEALPNNEAFEKLRLQNAEQLSAVKVAYTPALTYWNYLSWRPIWKCCPRFYNYGCRSSSKRLGMFYNWNHFHREWCFPITPVYIRRCLCSECWIQNLFCPRKGRCNRRYFRRSFWAICNRGFGWSYFRYIKNKWLPSGCYCRASKYVYTATTVKSCQN